MSNRSRIGDKYVCIDTRNPEPWACPGDVAEVIKEVGGDLEAPHCWVVLWNPKMVEEWTFVSRDGEFYGWRKLT